MISFFLLRTKKLSGKLAWFYSFEYFTIDWIHEYEIEKFKAYNIIKRVSSWPKFYKFNSKHSTGNVELKEYTKVSALFYTFKNIVFHTKGLLGAEILLYYRNLVHFVSNYLHTSMLSFTTIKVEKTKHTNIWNESHLSGITVESDYYSKLSMETYNNILHSDRLTLDDNWFFNRPKLFRDIIIYDAYQMCKNFFKGRVYNSIFTFFKNLNKGNFFSIYLVFFFPLFIFAINDIFYFNSLKFAWLQFCLVLFFYFFISTFFHFSKTYNVNKYTSQTQRFWKRTFGVFWGLEFTLFFIYMYLTLISPAELPMLSINHKEIITGVDVVRLSTYHFLYFLVLLFLNFFYHILFFLKKKNNFHFFKPVLIVISLLYCFVLYYEFYKLYYVAGWGSHSVYNSLKSFSNTFEYGLLENNIYSKKISNQLHFKVPSTLNNVWNETLNEKQWLRTFRHFIYIMILLKFWHIFFIYFYFVLSLLKFLETDYWSFDTISSNHQNSIYILWFYLFSYLLIIKKKLYFTIIFVYYWSFVQVNFADFLFSLLNEVNLSFIF